MKWLRHPNSKWIWLILRLWLGTKWLRAGLYRLTLPAWIGENSGLAVVAHLWAANQRTFDHDPMVKPWIRWVNMELLIPHAKFISYFIVFSEMIIGICLIIGWCTIIVSFFAAFLNLAFLYTGFVGPNPEMYTVAILLIIAGLRGGEVGIDGWIRRKRMMR